MEKPLLIVVDDELDMATLVAELAEFVGFQTEVVSSASQLLKSVEQHSHQVMVIDLFMPDMDGFELIGALGEKNCKAAIVLVSGYDISLLGGAGKIARAKGLNLLGTLSKPFRLEELEAMLRRAFVEPDRD